MNKTALGLARCSPATDVHRLNRFYLPESEEFRNVCFRLIMPARLNEIAEKPLNESSWWTCSVSPSAQPSKRLTVGSSSGSSPIISPTITHKRRTSRLIKLLNSLFEVEGSQLFSWAWKKLINFKTSSHNERQKIDSNDFNVSFLLRVFPITIARLLKHAHSEDCLSADNSRRDVIFLYR